jgi:hypothetical protein
MSINRFIIVGAISDSTLFDAARSPIFEPTWGKLEKGADLWHLTLVTESALIVVSG